MPPDEDDNQGFTYNSLTNEDKELLFRHGYRPGELSPEEARELVADLRDQVEDDEDDRLSDETSADERDGT
jgi:polyhydroxyalkanoate synthesis regulator phasin